MNPWRDDPRAGFTPEECEVLDALAVAHDEVGSCYELAQYAAEVAECELEPIRRSRENTQRLMGWLP